MDPRKSKEIINEAEKKKFLELKEEDITTSFIMETFGNFGDKPKYYPYDLIRIPEDSYGPKGKRNKKPFMTTLGLWIFNKYFIEKDLFNVFGYISESVNSDLFGNINQ